MRVHFIAIGGSVVFDRIISRHKKGYRETGTDNEVFEPSESQRNEAIAANFKISPTC